MLNERTQRNIIGIHSAPCRNGNRRASPIVLESDLCVARTQRAKLPWNIREAKCHLPIPVFRTVKLRASAATRSEQQKCQQKYSLPESSHCAQHLHGADVSSRMAICPQLLPACRGFFWRIPVARPSFGEDGPSLVEPTSITAFSSDARTLDFQS